MEISVYVRTAFLTANILLCAAPSFGQTPESGGRAFRGIFGGGNPDSQQSGGLDLSASFRQVLDDDVTGQSSGALTVPRPAVSGLSSRVAVALDYRRLTDSLSLAANARSSGAYFPDFEDLSALTHSGVLSIRTANERTNFGIVASAAKTPFYSLSLQSDIRAIDSSFLRDPLDDVHVTRRDALRYAGAASFSHQFTERTLFSATGGWRRSDFLIGEQDITHASGSLRLTRKLTKHLAVNGGYGYQSGEYGNSEHSTSEDILAGVTFDRPLSRTRRTFVSFSSGVSTLRDDRRPDRTIRLTGSAGLRRLIGRTWVAALNYDRATRYLEGLGPPIISDAVTTTVTGFVSRRVNVSVTGAYITGVLGYSGSGRGYDNYYSISTVQVALNRLTALTAEYLHYHYQFEQDPEIADLPTRFDRNGVRVGVSFWLPLLN